jgi:hypothetical protein
MDPIDTLATNSQSYWTRLDDSKRCFESDTSPMKPVHVVDVPAAAKLLPSAAVLLRKQECADLEGLEDYLDNPANATYTSRLMCVIIITEQRLIH